MSASAARWSEANSGNHCTDLEALKAENARLRALLESAQAATSLREEREVQHPEPLSTPSSRAVCSPLAATLRKELGEVGTGQRVDMAAQVVNLKNQVRVLELEVAKRDYLNASLETKVEQPQAGGHLQEKMVSESKLDYVPWSRDGSVVQSQVFIYLKATNAWLPLVRVGPATPITYEFVPAREGMVANGWPLGASTWDNDWDSPIEDWCPRTPSAVEGPAARCGSDCSWSGESLWEGSGDEEEEVDRVRAYEESMGWNEGVRAQRPVTTLAVACRLMSGVLGEPGIRNEAAERALKAEWDALRAEKDAKKAARHAGNDEKRRARASPSASASQCAGRAPSSSPSPGYIDHSEPAKGVVQPGVFGEGEGGQGRAAAAGPARGSGRRKGKGRSRGRGRAMRTWGHDGFKQLYGRSGSN